MSDNISSLFNTIENTAIPYKLNPDVYYIPHTKAHLENNSQYRKERREWAKLQHTECVAWGLFRIKDEFLIKYLIPFHEDIEKFVSYYPGLRPHEIAEKFCKSWKLYNDVFGTELIERAIILSMWQNPETAGINFEISNLTDVNCLKREYTSYEIYYTLTPSIFFSPDCPACVEEIESFPPGSTLSITREPLKKGIMSGTMIMKKKKMMTMKKSKSNYKIIGCDHRFTPENPFKKCEDCTLKITDLECLDNIACAERYYVYQKIG